MCEASSKIDPRSELWGEIQVNYNPSATVNLWKPIKEYQNISVDNERNIDEQIHPTNNTALASENEEDLYHDPVGSHIIKLREYHYHLTEYLHAKQEEAERRKKFPGKEVSLKKRKSRKLYFSIPEFPKQYPFSHSLKATSQDKGKIIVKCKGEMPKCQVKEKRILFIKSVLAQTGFWVKDTQSEKVLFEYLSDILDDFLQKFVRLFFRNKNSDPFAEDEDLWSPLETTLRNFGISGISGLHAFYYENVAKKHDILLNKCMDLYTEFKNFDDKF